MMHMAKVQVFISGFVQGVGFRAFVKKSALKIGVKGWIRNLRDGRVEAILQGEKDVLVKLIQLCKKGPFLSEVKSIEVFWNKNDNEKFFEGFEIIR